MALCSPVRRAGQWIVWFRIEANGLDGRRWRPERRAPSLVARCDEVADVVLGTAPSSHGCISHADDAAKRIYDNLGDGATVVGQHC